MRNKDYLKKSWICLFVGLLLFGSCDQEMDKYYDIPKSLTGNAMEILEERGNYTHFLNAVERIGYTDVISGRGIVTVLAPTDQAFEKWLADNNYSSVQDVPEAELNKLITFHLIYYSFNKESFANFRPEGASNENSSTASTAGLYYKFRTRSKDPISQVLDNTVSPGQDQVIRNIYHYDRFVPVLSTYLFETKGIDAAYNYEYFYPDNTWSAEQAGDFEISNASVIDYAIVADNGYVYTIDKMLEPLETIYTELENNSNYSDFLKIYERFTGFELDNEATQNYGNGEDLYLRGFLAGLPQIAWEWPTNYYYELAVLSRKTYNIFAPDNNSLQVFFNEFWADYYDSFDKVPYTPLRFLLENHFAEEVDIVFPEEIKKGKILTNFGTTIDFDPENTDLRRLCANGTLYGLNNVMKPRMFESVTAPMFQNPNYNYFLLLIDNAYNLISALTSENTEFSLFLPTNQTVLKTSISGSGLSYANQNPNLYGGEEIQMEGDDGPVSIGLGTKNSLTSNHIGSRLVSSVGNYKVFETLSSFQYLLLDEETDKVYSSEIYNLYPGRAPTATPIYNAYNGVTYSLDGTADEEQMMLLADNSLFKNVMVQGTPSQFQQMRVQYNRAQFTSSPFFGFMMGNRFIALVVENDVLTERAGEFPTNNAAGLDNALKYYFIDVNTSNLGGYPFPGSGIEGEVQTFCVNSKGERAKLTIIDTGTEIQFKDVKGNIVKATNLFPNIYADGAAYLIDGLLEFE